MRAPVTDRRPLSFISPGQCGAAVDVINRRNGADIVGLGSLLYREKGDDGKSIKFVNAICCAKKSPDYSTRLGAFVVA